MSLTVILSILAAFAAALVLAAVLIENPGVQRRARDFYQPLYRSILLPAKRTLFGDERWQHILPIAYGLGLYLPIPREGIVLWCGEDGSVDISHAEAKMLVTSIEAACERREIVEIKIKDFYWRTDARPKRNPDRVIVRTIGRMGRTTRWVSRLGLLSACKQFHDVFDKPAESG